MRIKIGFNLENLPTFSTAPVGRTYFLGNGLIDNPNNILSPRFTVKSGDRITGAGIWARTSSATGVGQAGVCPYFFPEAGAAQKRHFEIPITITGNVNNWFHTSADMDISEFSGETWGVAMGKYSAARILQSQTDGNGNFITGDFPEALQGSIGITATLICAYLEIESPPPDGYADIIVGADPIYGTNESIVKEYIGAPPTQGDQLRVPLFSQGGAALTVKANLTYSGAYPEGIEIPSTDFIDVQWWTGTGWYTYTVTLNLNTGGSLPVNSIRPSIEGIYAVRQTLIINTGEWIAADSFTYEWFVNGTSTGITGSEFVTADYNYQQIVTCAVTAFNTSGSKNVTSTPTTPLDGVFPEIHPFSISIQGAAKICASFSALLSLTEIAEMNLVNLQWFIEGDSSPFSEVTHQIIIPEIARDKNILMKVTSTNSTKSMDNH